LILAISQAFDLLRENISFSGMLVITQA